MTELRESMQRSVAGSPHPHLDVDHVVAMGRRRLRRRRYAGIGSGAAAVAAGAALTLAIDWMPSADVAPAEAPPKPDAPTLRLADAKKAVEGTDYEVVVSNDWNGFANDPGAELYGVTDDGLVLVRDAGGEATPGARLGLMDAATEEVDWLPPAPGIGSGAPGVMELSAERLVLTTRTDKDRLTAHVFDRGAGEWHTVQWADLPADEGLRTTLGPDDRLYATVPATAGQVPEGGWPTGPGGEADDANADGDTYHLWSVSLTDKADVRDEELTVGDVAFTDEAMIWTDATNGDAGQVHVRDLATDKVHSFDPRSGERCNLLNFEAADDRIVMSQYCGTSTDGTRDDRVQIVSTDGEQVVTVQDDSIEGSLGGPDSSVVRIVRYGAEDGGVWVYDLQAEELKQLSTSVSSSDSSFISAPGRHVVWSVPAENGADEGAETQYLGRLTP